MGASRSSSPCHPQIYPNKLNTFSHRLLHTDPTPQALQVFLRPKPDAGVENQASEDEGTWIDANPMEGCVVVNVGEMVGLTFHSLFHYLEGYANLMINDTRD